LAATAAAYRTVGGIPAIPLAEDRAFAEQIAAHDLRLRHSHLPVVYTSARQSGRAPGGFADLIRGFANDSDMPCDAALEPTRLLALRLRRRARCRADGANGFGARWAGIEANAPELARRRLYPCDLPAEVILATRLIASLAERGGDRDDTRLFAAEA